MNLLCSSSSRYVTGVKLLCVRTEPFYDPAGTGGKIFKLRRPRTENQYCCRRNTSERAGVGGGVCARVMHGSRMTIDPRIPLQCRDDACRVFTDQADIACTKRETPRGVRRVE